MRQKPSESKRRSRVRRKLGCERLEQRALLTGLIASAEIAPGPIAEFTTQAKSFVESALDHVMATQHQSPVKTSTDKSTGVAEDGRSVRITNYTVELATPRQSTTGSGVPVSGAIEVSSATNNSSRSNLVFSFLIYADSSVSIRAKLNNPPQWVGFWPSNYDLHERLRLRSSAADSSQIPALPPADLTGDRESLVGSELVQDTTPSAVNALGDLLRAEEEPSASAELRRHAAADPFDSLVGEMVWLELDGEVTQETVELGKVKQATRVESAGIAKNSTVERGVDFEVRLAAEVDGDGLPVVQGMYVQGMIPLDFTPSVAAEVAAMVAAPPASGIYQVFVHSSDSHAWGTDVSTGDNATGGHAAGEAPGLASNAVASPREEVVPSEELSLSEVPAPSRWQSTTVALASMVGGLAWGLRPRRDEQGADLLAKSKAR